MKWMKQLMSSFAISAAKFITVTVLAYFGVTSDKFHALWLLFRGCPSWLQVVVWLVLTFVVITLIVHIFRRPIDPSNPDSLPRYFWFYLPVIRRVSWRFERLFNGFVDHDGKYQIANFSFYLRSNWWRDLHPVSAVIRSRVNGKSIEVSLAAPSPSSGYLPTSAIESCAHGVWVSGMAEFRPPIAADKFLEEFGDFDFIFEYDRHESFRRYVSKIEIQKYVDRWQNFFAEQRRRSMPAVQLKTSKES